MKLIQTRRDKHRAFEILENAFQSSPGMNWMLKDRSSKHAKKWILRVLYTDAQLRNGAYLTSDRNGVVFFYHLSKKGISATGIFQKIYVLLFISGIKNGLRSIKYQKKIAAIRPKSGWLGMISATDSSANGTKAAFEIKNEMFRIADDTNEDIYVETTVPRVKLLYQAAGYELYFTMEHPYDDLTIWFLHRRPFIYSQIKRA